VFEGEGSSGAVIIDLTYVTVRLDLIARLVGECALELKLEVASYNSAEL